MPFDRGEIPKEKIGRVSLLTRLQYLSVIILAIIGIGYLLSLSTDAQIKVTGEQAFPRDHSEYERAITRELNSSILNRNKLSINSRKIAQIIRQEFPEVRNVELKTGLLRHRPVVNVELAKPTARLTTKTTTYVLDSEGYALFDANSSSANFDVNSLVVIHDRSGQPITIGKPALTTDQITYVNELLGQLEKKKISATEMRLEGGGLELHVRLSGKNYYVKFSFLSDARQSSGALVALHEKNISASEYIDLRIPDRAFVK